mgnify:CR=1 FL=1
MNTLNNLCRSVFLNATFGNPYRVKYPENYNYSFCTDYPPLYKIFLKTKSENLKNNIERYLEQLQEQYNLAHIYIEKEQEGIYLNHLEPDIEEEPDTYKEHYKNLNHMLEKEYKYGSLMFNYNVSNQSYAYVINLDDE